MCSAGLAVGIDGLKELSQPKYFYDSIIWVLFSDSKHSLETASALEPDLLSTTQHH